MLPWKQLGSCRKSLWSCKWEELPPLSSHSNYMVHSSRKSEGSLLLCGLIAEEPAAGGGFLRGSVGCWLQRDLAAMCSSGSEAGISTFKPACSLTCNIPLSFLSSCQGRWVMGNTRQAGDLAGWWWAWSGFGHPGSVCKVEGSCLCSQTLSWWWIHIQGYVAVKMKSSRIFCQSRIFQLVSERALLGGFMQLSGLDFHTAFYLTPFTRVKDSVLSRLHPQRGRSWFSASLTGWCLLSP